MFVRASKVFLMVLAVSMLTACASKKPPTGESRDVLVKQVETSIARFKEKDPSIKRFFDDSYGYALFPTIAKGAVGVGGANGRGLVYTQGDLTGYATVSQATIGFQLGGQSYSEVIFFKDKVDFDHFRQGQLEFDAQASAVAVSAGASADADYSKGVAVFTMTNGGLMYEASIGGQKFHYAAISD